MTEDYEMGLRLGALGVRTMFVRLPALPGSRAVVSSRGHFPASLDDAVRQKARWIGGIAFAGWDRLGWRGGLGERWMRMRDRRGPLAALVIFAGYLAAFLWSQMWLAHAARRTASGGAFARALRLADHQRLAARLARLDAGRLHHRGLRPGARACIAIPRLVVGNLIALLAARRAFFVHATGGPRQWDKTRHIFPTELPRG